LWAKPWNFCLLCWKSNTMSSYSDTTSYNSSPDRSGGATSLFNSANKKIFSILSVLVIYWQESLVEIKKKDVLPSFVNVKALLFSLQYEHGSFSCMLQPETIPYAGKSLIVHIKFAFIWKFCFLDTSYVKAPDDHNYFNSSINKQKRTSIF